MYYIDNDIEFLEGIRRVNYGFHFISRYQIDYVNNKTEIQISSNISRAVWEDNNFSSPFVNFYELDKVPLFAEDPVNFILRQLVSHEGTVFFGAEVKRDYNLTTIIRN